MDGVTHLFVNTTGHLNVADDPAYIVVIASLKLQA